MATATRVTSGAAQYATFFLNGMYFGVPVLQVQEVIRSPQVTRVPLAAPDVVGLVNLRGEIAPVIDLRRRLSLPVEKGPKDPLQVVVRSSEGAVGLMVDEIGDVIDVDLGSREPPPRTLPRGMVGLVTGVYKFDKALLLALDIESVVRVDGRA